MVIRINYFGTAIVYINMVILIIVMILAIRLYLKYCKYLEVRRKYIKKKSHEFNS